MTTTPNMDIRDGYAEKYGFHDEDKFVFRARRGLDAEIVAQISDMKGEPRWMRDYRLKALEIFQQKPMPKSAKAKRQSMQKVASRSWWWRMIFL